MIPANLSAAVGDTTMSDSLLRTLVLHTHWIQWVLIIFHLVILNMMI